ncbi:hypothetical protein BU17DRAFT_103775 [Hysterangium stoloniferum]|nr:hypothetical protein BU17DRAFT_103775 [Hysterangium stoloniferum]
MSRNITFDEVDCKLFPIPDEHESIAEITPLEGEDDTYEWQPENGPATPQTSAATTPNPSNIEAPSHELRRSSRTTNKPNYRILNDPGAESTDQAFISHKIVTEPSSYIEAVAQADAPIWESAMQTEMNQHHEIGTWEL